MDIPNPRLQQVHSTKTTAILVLYDKTRFATSSNATFTVCSFSSSHSFHSLGHVSNPKPDPPSEDICNIIRSFLRRFDITGLPSIEDAAREDLCIKEAEHRGYAVDVLRPYLTVGFNITPAAYNHLVNVNVKSYIVFFTAYATYLYGVYPDDLDALVGVPIPTHFVLGEAAKQDAEQLCKSSGRSASVLWPSRHDFIVHASLKFITMLVLEILSKDEPVSVIYAFMVRSTHQDAPS
ncbi:uncharacterized protein ARMOST_02511 [Armillaria ostoyae]|uniref:Uncharacterized protein n=1 Tax=Armillaria ostoyae TaxID=47428 RepID=A0A284QRW5_ARMOS|nr:uncharacterized protein ARMOST_02511 [Armillaria ostoyae]